MMGLALRRRAALLAVLIPASCFAGPPMSYVVVSAGWLGGGSTVWMDRSGCLLSLGREHGRKLPTSSGRLSAMQASAVVNAIEHPADGRGAVPMAPDVPMTSVYVRFADGSMVQQVVHPAAGSDFTRVVEMVNTFSGHRVYHPSAGKVEPDPDCPAEDDILAMIKTAQQR